MADVEMDVDAMHQPSLEVPADDDLINYESDAADYTLMPDENLAVEPVPEILQEAYPGAGEGEQSGEIDALEQSALDSGDGALDTANAALPELPDDTEAIDQVAEADLPLDADAAEAALDALTGTVGDEIDYSYGEVDYQDGNDEEVQQHTIAAEEAPVPSEEAIVDGRADKAEISWEDDNADGHDVAAEEEEPIDDDQVQEDESIQENAFQFGDLSDQPAAEDDEAESRDYRQDELQALEDAITGGTSMGAAEVPADGVESHFPSITVQYHGDEFPFLSSGTEGFFTDASILDESMPSIFSGFRSQLGNDIRAEDELVFQVDELGLEFTESNTSSNLTMHQILEVFDLLVKNDDPDGTRTLYTYLFTRLNSSRRYEYLVESATSGKGLDEVQHLFPQQSSHNESEVDNGDDSAMSSEHAEDHGEVGYDENEDQHQDEEQQQDDDIREPAEEYHEDPAQEHQEAEYFDEAADHIGGVTHEDDAAIDEEHNEDAEHAHDDSYVHERSSTTSTLQGDADATALSGDADADDDTAVDAEADGPVFVAEANDDAEIDWRDDDEGDIIGDGGSVTGKRSRDDDEEPDVDDEIGMLIFHSDSYAYANASTDFKRRRP